MAPLLIPAEWVKDKLNNYKIFKAAIVERKKELKSKEKRQALDNLLIRYKDLEGLLKEMKEASITKP